VVLKEFFCLSLALHENVVVSGSYKEIIVWNAKTRRNIHVLKSIHGDHVHCLQTVGDHRFWSGSSSKDGSICIWAKGIQRWSTNVFKIIR